MFDFKQKLGGSERDTGPTPTIITLPANKFDNKTPTKTGLYLFRKIGRVGMRYVPQKNNTTC